MSTLTCIPGLIRPILADLSRRLDWIDFAACAEIGTDLFFPDNAPVPHAKTVCAGCPVTEQCLRYALDFERQGYAPHGVYGGVSGAERQATLVAERKEAV